MKPTVGRIVHYFEKPGSDPLAAIITGVYDDDSLDLDVHQRPTSKRHRASMLSMQKVGPVDESSGGWGWPLMVDEPQSAAPVAQSWPPAQSAVDALTNSLSGESDDS